MVLHKNIWRTFDQSIQNTTVQVAEVPDLTRPAQNQGLDYMSSGGHFQHSWFYELTETWSSCSYFLNTMFKWSCCFASLMERFRFKMGFLKKMSNPVTFPFLHEFSSLQVFEVFPCAKPVFFSLTYDNCFVFPNDA